MLRTITFNDNGLISPDRRPQSAHAHEVGYYLPVTSGLLPAICQKGEMKVYNENFFRDLVRLLSGLAITC